MSNYLTGYEKTIKTAGLRDVLQRMKRDGAGHVWQPSFHREVDQLMRPLGSPDESRVRKAWRQLRHVDGDLEPPLHSWKNVPETPMPQVGRPDWTLKNQVARDLMRDRDAWGASMGGEFTRAKSIAKTLLKGPE